MTPHADAPDAAATTSPEGLVAALYAAISFAPGTRPDWGRIRALYAPGARLVRMTPEAVVAMTIEDWIRGFAGWIDDGTFPSFWEGEIASRCEQFGDIVHLWSTYETRLAPNGPLIGRGINSIQAIWRDDRWWVNSILWTRETPERPIPKRDSGAAP